MRWKDFSAAYLAKPLREAKHKADRGRGRQSTRLHLGHRFWLQCKGARDAGVTTVRMDQRGPFGIR